MRTVFFRVLEADDKAAALLSAIRDPAAAGSRRYEVNIRTFSALPQCPFVYRIPAPMLALAVGRHTLQAAGAEARQGFGASTRFHRLAWEVCPSDIGAGRPWLWLAHGTKPSPFFKPTFHVVLWGDHGREAKADVLTRYPYLNGNYGFKIQAEESYGRAGLCYGKRTGLFTVQVMPPEHAFSFEGTAIHVAESASVGIWSLLALLNSRPVAFWLNSVSAQHKAYTYVNTSPIPEKNDDALGTLARTGWQLQFELRGALETGNHFTVPALLLTRGETLAARAGAWDEHVGIIESELAAIQAEIDERCFDLYGIDEADRRAITEGFGGTDRSESKEDADSDADDDEIESIADTAALVAELVSWAVGVAFGRFDVRLATGTRGLPPEPEPFDALPVCSPAILTDEDGLPLPSPPLDYPLTFPANGILVNDVGHLRDLTDAVRAVFDEIFGARADHIWQEAAFLLDPKGHDLRTWLSSGFFDHHLKRYSKGRRKAPIFWQLGVPSGRTSVWLYARRLTRDSAFQLQNDVIAPKLALEERQLTSLVQEAGGNPSASERKRIASQETFIEELSALFDEVERVAPLWNPSLDDGVVITMAPLWRLVPQHKAWQKELKAKWGDLCAGTYDWAHLAMHLWPERVVPKCATDRSLAIAHGLEDVFWVKGNDDKWTARPIPTRSIKELVEERTSPAVKAALASLVAAPSSVPRRSGRSRPNPPAALNEGTS